MTRFILLIAARSSRNSSVWDVRMFRQICLRNGDGRFRTIRVLSPYRRADLSMSSNQVSTIRRVRNWIVMPTLRALAGCDEIGEEFAVLNRPKLGLICDQKMIEAIDDLQHFFAECF